jgi:radical SAM protein with 4Fe4S-binding SPASM domain
VAAQHVPPGDDAVVFFRQLDCPTPEMQAVENGVFRETVAQMGLSLDQETQTTRRVAAENLTACSGFWKSPVIGWNGDVTVCTRDNRFENKIGNINETPFSQIWWSAQLTARRKLVAKGDYSGLALCQTCFIPKSANYADINPTEIAAHGSWEAPCQ